MPSDVQTEDSFRCSACGQCHDGTHHCPESPGDTDWRQAKKGYEMVDSVEEAREALESLERGETMLKSVVQGDGLFAGHCDEVRPSRAGEDRFQIQPPLIGSCHHADLDEIAAGIYRKQLPIKVVEWEDRIP